MVKMGAFLVSPGWPDLCPYIPSPLYLHSRAVLGLQLGVGLLHKANCTFLEITPQGSHICFPWSFLVQCSACGPILSMDSFSLPYPVTLVF